MKKQKMKTMKTNKQTYLIHWGLTKGQQSKDHKYIARIKDSLNKYRYFYTQEAIDAYKNAKSNISTAANNARTSANKALTTARSNISTAANNAQTSANKALTTARSNISTTANKVKDLFTDKNLYNVTPSNYTAKKAAIQKTKEWKDITNDKNSEYLVKKSDGSTYYDFDQYLVDKKHPVLKAVRDVFNGKKVSLSKQNAKTLVAGAKDYIRVAENAANLAGEVSYAIVQAQLKNSQGSYEQQKKDITKAINNTANAVDSASKAINKATESANSSANNVNNSASDITNQVENATALLNRATSGKLSKEDIETVTKLADELTNGKATETTKLVKKLQNGTITDSEAKQITNEIKEAASKNQMISQLSSAAIKAYADSYGVDEKTAKKMLIDASEKTINYYLNNY